MLILMRKSYQFIIINLSLQLQMIQCHFCSESFEKIDTSSVAKCCMKRCNRYYCIQCIKHFNSEFDMQMYKKETWICFSCQGICNCERCKKQETGNSDKKPKKRGPQRQKMQGCEESLEHSVSNISPNAPKTDSFQPVMQEQEQNNSYLQQNESDDMQEELEELEFKTYTEEQMAQFPPFYRKIAERRNKFCAFVIKQYKKRKQISKLRKQGAKQKINHNLLKANE